MNLAQLAQADPELLSELVPQLLAGALAEPDVDRLKQICSTVTPSEWGTLMSYLSELGDEHRVYASHSGLRKVSRTWMEELLVPWRVEGTEHLLDAIAAGPTVLVTNHLSYVDANAKDALIAWACGEQVADRIAYLAGPKVYADPFRRVSSGGISSLPVPQSARLGHNEQPLAARELARRAFQTVEASQGFLAGGGVICFYPEGSRSRSGRLESFFKGTRRYLRSAVRLVPAALVGTEQVMPLGIERLTPAPVSLTFAPAISLEDLGGREALAMAFEHVAARLPSTMQPSDDTPSLR